MLNTALTLIGIFGSNSPMRRFLISQYRTAIANFYFGGTLQQQSHMLAQFCDLLVLGRNHLVQILDGRGLFGQKDFQLFDTFIHCVGLRRAGWACKPCSFG